MLGSIVVRVPDFEINRSRVQFSLTVLSSMVMFLLTGCHKAVEFGSKVNRHIVRRTGPVSIVLLLWLLLLAMESEVRATQ